MTRRTNGPGMKKKGDDYERALARWLNDRLGLSQIARAPLSGGGKVGLTGGADLIGAPSLFVEAKRTERMRPHEFMAQAVTNVRKTRTPDWPVVISRRNRQQMGDSLVLMRLEDWVHLYHAFLAWTGHVPDPCLPQPEEPDQ